LDSQILLFEIVRTLQEMILFNPKTGEPIGRGFGQNRDQLRVGIEKLIFADTGTYTYQLRQFMRQDTLIGIQKVGIRIIPKQDNSQ